MKILTFITILFYSCCSLSSAIEVEDFLGRKVELEKPAKRIIALAPHIVENLFSVGLGEAVVGAVDYCDYPEAAKKIPRVGNYASISLESLLALKPDLVIVWSSGSGAHLIPKLKKLSIPVYVDEPHKLEDVAESMNDLAILGGKQNLGREKSQAFKQRLKKIRKEWKDKKSLRLFFQVWHEPLQSLNGKHIVSDVLRACGAINIFADELAIAPKVSLEAVIQRNPQVILTGSKSEKRPEELNYWQKFPMLEAVKQDALIYINPDLLHRHSERILDGAELLCGQINKYRE